MHQLESAALDDPFLQDAIDGYSEMQYQTGSAEITAILKEVESYEPNPATHRYKNIVIAVWQKKIMQYAVAAMLTGVAGWYLINLSQPKEKEQPALVKTKPQVVPPAPAVTTKTDPSPAPDSTTVAVLEKKEQPSQNTLPLLLKKEEAPKNREKDTFITTAIDDKPDQQVAAATVKQSAAPAAEEPAAKAPASAGKLITGKVTDADSYPLDGIALRVKGAKNSILTDELGRFNITVPDSNATIIASAPGYKTKEVSAYSFSRNTNLKLEKAAQSLDEVVVSGYASKGVAAEPEIDTTEAVPAGGWQNFINYIEQNKKLKHKGRQAEVVVIGFEVDKTGKASEFDILQSAGVAYDNEAMRLLKDGPAWINKTRNPYPAVKLTITF